MGAIPYNRTVPSPEKSLMWRTVCFAPYKRIKVDPVKRLSGVMGRDLGQRQRGSCHIKAYDHRFVGPSLWPSGRPRGQKWYANASFIEAVLAVAQCSVVGMVLLSGGNASIVAEKEDNGVVRWPACSNASKRRPMF